MSSKVRKPILPKFPHLRPMLIINKPEDEPGHLIHVQEAQALKQLILELIGLIQQTHIVAIDILAIIHVGGGGFMQVLKNVLLDFGLLLGV